ncbi:hypothetical protein [Streptomyces anthocyanicus]|uniref:hypothetical protein n=1 Tax=Streptomyces anthocyanicus TaxID=68174 RepID=UPI003818A5A0
MNGSRRRWPASPKPLLAGSLVEHGLAAFALVLGIVKRSDDTRGFVVLPKR